MSTMKVEQESSGTTRRVAVIGDLVGSRRSADRQRLHDVFTAQLDQVRTRVPAISPLQITVGDECQGVFATLGDALRATILLQVSMRAAGADLRFGIGRGEIHTLDAARGIVDGSAYWNARAAIEATEKRAQSARTRTARVTVHVDPDDPDAPTASAVQAALDCLDFMVGSLSDSSLLILEGLMDDRTQDDIAAEVGISPSAVSQRVLNHGLGVITSVAERLGEQP